MILTDRFKLAFKTALAMVIAYGVALAMDWSNPYWAGLAIVLCGFSTSGESLFKGLLRISGTFAALVVSLTLIALYPQERWAFMAFMSLFIGVCIYMQMGTSRWYFWYVAAFSVPLLSVAGGANGLNDFAVVMLRLQETILGVVTYTLVSITLWPLSSRETFKETVAILVDTERRLFKHCLALALGTAPGEDPQALSRRAAASLARLPSLLDAATLDSFEIDEARHAWRRSARLLNELEEALESWRQGFGETAHLPLLDVFPGNRGLIGAIDSRFAGIAAMLAGRALQEPPSVAGLQVDEAALADLSHVDRAALRLFRDRVEVIDRLTRSLFEAVAEACDFAPLRGAPEPRTVSLPRLLDPARLAAVLRVEVALWLAILAIVYVPGLPDGATVLVLAVSFTGSIVKDAPHIRALVMLPALLLGIAIGACAYIFIMPQLSGFPSLALLIFTIVFGASYWFWTPAQSIQKSSVILLFLIIAGINNEQQYNALHALDLSVAFLVTLLIISISGYIPTSQRAEAATFVLLRRFFKSCEGLMSNDIARWRRSILLYLVRSVPGRVRGALRALPHGALPEGTRRHLDHFSVSLEALARRMATLDEARAEPQSEDVRRALRDDAQAWRRAIRDVFGMLAQDPVAAEPSALRARLDEALARINARIDTVATIAGDGSFSREENDRMYRLLGAYRGLAEALVDLSGSAAPVRWSRIREAGF